MHSNLNFHHAQADTPRVSSSNLVKDLATKALKHIPGGVEAISKAFSKAAIPVDIPPHKNINLVMHMGHTH